MAIADEPQGWGKTQLVKPRWLEFNVNSAVRVKLTGVGLAEYRRQREELNARLPPTFKGFPLTPTLDDEGYYQTAMWTLMQDFGHLCGIGKEMPFETDILLESAPATPD